MQSHPGLNRKRMMMDFNLVGPTSSFGSAPKVLICGLAEKYVLPVHSGLMYVQFILVD